MSPQTGEHKLAQIIITPIVLIDGSPVVDPEGIEAVQYGCIVCNAGLDEAKELPCLGEDLAERWEAIGDGRD